MTATPPLRGTAGEGMRGVMANKVYKDAKSALEGVLQDGMMVMCGGFGLVGIPDKLIHALRDAGVKDLTCVSNNAGIDGARARPAARDRAGEEDDQFLRRREQDLRQALPRGQARDRVQPAGHAGRALPRRRRRHPRLLHQDRRRHRGRQGQGDQGLRRPGICHGARPGRRSRPGQGVEGRRLGQPRLSQGGAKLQSDDGDGGQALHRRGRGARAGGRASIPTTSTRPASSSTASSAVRPTTRRSSNAPFARLEERERWPGPAIRWRRAPPRN